jgi:hypothetical protein
MRGRHWRWRRTHLPFAARTLVTLALAASCGPVEPPPPSPILVNACPPDNCDAYQQPSGVAPASCSSQRCTSSTLSTDIDFTLIVSRPQTSFDDPGATIAIPHFPGFMAHHLCGPSSPDNCVQIPLAVRPSGSFIVSKGVESCVGRPIDPTGASLPIVAQFWPLWSSDPSSKVFVPAPVAGLPLLPVSARACEGCVLNAGVAVPGGPGGTPATYWGDALLNPGTYEEDLVPLDPAYPPQRLIGVITSSPQVNLIVSLDTNECPSAVAPTTPQVTSFDVSRGNGSLAGFTAYLSDSSTNRRISSLATLPDAMTAPITLLTSGVEVASSGLWPSGSEIIVQPPPGLPIPTYADPIAPVAQLGPVNYPSLPSPITVQGVVRGPDGSPIDADLLIDSTAPSLSQGGIYICSSPDCTQLSPPSTQRPLTYATTAHATAAGGYSVVLPPGGYDVFVVPSIGANAGAGSVPLGVQAVLDPAVPLVAAGKTLTAPPVATIGGTVTLADGRALVGATVEAHASASTAGTIVPSIARADPRRVPRTVGTITDAAGAFTLTADPGIYDIVVRPEDGTGFPWVTISSQSVVAGSVLSFRAPGSAIRVPAPILLELILEDAFQNSVTDAIVRVFSVLPRATPLLPGAPLPEVEIGSALTDSTGHFQAFIVPPE